MSLVILLTMSAVAQGANSAEGLSPVALQCEYRVNPLGIDVAKPRLSWKVESSARGQRQTAYRILVASDEAKLAADEGDLWDSGKVESDATSQIEYAGAALTSRMRCHWKVMVWDKDGKPSAWSAPAFWTMGLLANTDWQAKWVGYDTTSMNEDPELMLPPSPYLRKAFAVDKKVRRATVYATALGLFELSLNGKRVGNDVFTPGWTDYNKRVYYHTYDVTELVNAGGNAISAVLSNGWYAGYVGFGLLLKHENGGRGYYGQAPELLAQLEIEYDDGSRFVVGTDESWKASTGPIRSSDLQMGETYDATKEIGAWDTAGFDDAAWKPVTLMEPSKGVVQAFPGVPVQVTEEIKAKKVTPLKDNVYLFDMGQNFAGRVRLKVNGPAGTKIVLRFGEMLHDDGSLMTENLRKARATDTYVLRGGGEEVWEPRFTFHGFQYVEVTGYPGKPELDAITGVVLHSTTPQAGTFACDNDMVNQLYSNINWTQRANFIEIPTDCPQRDERLGWTGDAEIYVRSATWNRDVSAFFTKWLVDLEDAQRPSGAFPDFAPLPYLQNEPSPAWMDAGIICPYTIYKVYGDTRVIERHYAAMQRQIDYYVKSGKDYLNKPVDHCWGDWLSLDEKTSEEFITTAYWAYDTKLMAEMAAAIGRADDAKKYDELFNNIKDAMTKAWVSPDGRIKDDTQTSYALALYMGLLPKELEQKAADRLVELIKARDWHLATGFLGVKHALPVLSEYGHEDVAFRLLTTTTYPSWGYSVVNGATTIWERWNGYTKEGGLHDPGMNSFSHYSFGSVCEWMFGYMAGIETDGPGFRHILIRPRPGNHGITHTKATYDSIRGPIASEWRVQDKTFTLDVTIPANTTAEIHVPTAKAEDVTEGGAPADKAEGVKFVRMEQGAAVFAVGSGTYRFAAPAKE